MKVLSRIVSVLALWIIRSEWLTLRACLVSAYQSHLHDLDCRPPVLAQQLLISGEDHRFFRHGGIDLVAVLRAGWRSVVHKRREGASTIEMQIVRVVSGRYERTLRRKVREMALATLVTRVIPKSDLPAVYLRIGYYGWRMNGFSAACQHIRLRSNLLSPREAARLVAQLKYPQPHYPPLHRQRQINARATHLLRLHGRHKDNYTYIGLLPESSYAAI